MCQEHLIAKLSHHIGPTVAIEILKTGGGKKKKVTKEKQVKSWNMKEGSKNNNTRESKSEY